ncbi:beta-1,3-N-acetylglucosaminyltransferase radical fringe-like [Myxocyprinus asiaticus]|uniref:beta-1,3-N-acetylglucosaminyltransferase radical fringe-like n=1 Tax=Myxocyprinus asiaticus TaxID=70543 RepID=UPI0022230DDF|nr:beta-1,3-N-acetylglucosaminyltransferase radical fringe-like [Myxocyprinus asiaticus]XP_051530954.1 beta-1,3-N-acetylglucosaminyltransferase radical fringe-like [Myxocyprinus asiaticus]
MHLSHVGTKKICFLLSLAFFALLVLFIPSLQPLQRQGDLPQPRPHAKPARVGWTHDLHRKSVSAGHHGNDNAKDDSFTHPLPLGGRPKDPQRVLEGAPAHADPPRSRSKDSLDSKDIFIAIKTTRKYHKSRLQLLSQTWVSKAKEQTFIFTDGEDKELRQRAGLNIINTNCSAAHTRQALCCKMSVEYDKFIESQKKWFCHVDDDNYVILPSLLELLSFYSHTQDVYLGRPSLDHPIEAAERVKSDGSVSVKFWFATGGAGFCISRGLALKMSPWASLGNFITTAEKIRLPDDCTIGYIIEALLEVPLTHTGLFHSHLENLQRLPTDSILKQVTLSYGGFENRRNVVNVGGAFSLSEDPSRFKTVHCLLYPNTEWCPRKSQH